MKRFSGMEETKYTEYSEENEDEKKIVDDEEEDGDETDEDDIAARIDRKCAGVAMRLDRKVAQWLA